MGNNWAPTLGFCHTVCYYVSLVLWQGCTPPAVLCISTSVFFILFCEDVRGLWHNQWLSMSVVDFGRGTSRRGRRCGELLDIPGVVLLDAEDCDCLILRSWQLGTNSCLLQAYRKLLPFTWGGCVLSSSVYSKAGCPPATLCAGSAECQA